jgi:hypothetical protein
MIIGLAGKKQSGKTTIGNYLQDERGFLILNWAAPLKEILGRQLFKLTDEQMYGHSRDDIIEHWGMSAREILQIVGTKLFRNNFRDDFWVHLAKPHIKQLVESNPKSGFAFGDCRFPNELDFIKSLGGAAVKIIREGMVSNDEHESENALNDYKFDYTISAKSGEIDTLKDQIDRIIIELSEWDS